MIKRQSAVYIPANVGIFWSVWAKWGRS